MERSEFTELKRRAVIKSLIWALGTLSIPGLIFFLRLDVTPLIKK